MKNPKYAGFNARMLAQNIDLAILLPVFYLLGWLIVNNMVLFLSCWLVYVFYNILFELSRWRGTPGKRIQKLKVTNVNGETVSITQIILRNMTKISSILLLFAGVIMIALDAKRRGLHDRLAGTVVLFC